jgi:hypothetical protein
VHHLRMAGLHARALAGGKDDGGSFGVWHDGLMGFLEWMADRPAAAAIASQMRKMPYPWVGSKPSCGAK